MKKFLSLLISVAMLASISVTTANAEMTALENQLKENLFDSWTVGYNAETSAQYAYAEHSDMSYEGTGSLKLYAETDTDTSVRLFVSQPLSQSAPAGNYTITMYARDLTEGADSENDAYINSGVIIDGLTSSDGGVFASLGSFNAKARVAGRDGKIWIKYQASVSPGGAFSKVRFRISQSKNILIDNFSLTDADGNEYITDGGFENYTARPKVSMGEIGAVAWSKNNWGNGTMSADYAYAGASEEAYSGYNSFLLAYPNDRTVNGSSMLEITKTLIEPVTGSVRVEFCAKGDFQAESIILKLGDKVTRIQYCEITNLGDGWKKYGITYNFGESTGNVFVLQIEEGCNYMYLDDIVVTSGTDTETNYIDNGDFEYVNYLPENKLYSELWCIKKTNVTSNSCFAEISDSDKRGGNASLRVSYPLDYKDNTYISATRYLSSIPESGQYNLSFYVKGEFNPLGVKADLGSVEIGRLSDSIFTVTEDANGWYKYETTFDFEKDGNYYFQLIFDRKIGKIFIDDIALTLSGSNVNLIDDGGFEKFKEYNKKEAVNFIAVPLNGGAVLSWVNPYECEITSYSLEMDDVQIAGDVEFSTVGNEFCEYKVDGLENGTVYNFKLKSVSDEGGKVSNATVIPREDYNTGTTSYNGNSLGRWYTFNSHTDEKYSNFAAMVDMNEFKSGKSSIKLVSNIAELTDNLSGHIGQIVTLKTDKAYQLSFDMKAVNCTRFIFGENASEAGYGFITNSVISSKESTDWVSKSYIIDAKDTMESNDYNTAISFIVDAACEGVWIDNVVLKEWSEGEAIGNNLISNGGFEFDNYEISNIRFDILNEDLTVSETGVDYVIGGKKYKAVITVKNIDNNNMPVKLYVPLYNGGKLVNVAVGETEVAENPYATEEISAVIDIPADSTAVYSLKGLVWGDNMVPYVSAKTIGQ